MTDTAVDHWFYSSEGERLGPVTLGDLRIKAKDGGLSPRLDMVWTQGMAEWKLAGEIDGLFDRSTAVEMRESLAAPALPQSAPLPSFDTERKALASEWPGARRLIFLITTFILPFLLSRGLKNITETFQERLGNELSGFVVLGVMFLATILIINASLQRLVNLGMSRWWFLGNFVPFLNLWVLFRCVACPSGYAYHKKLDTAGILLAIVFWLSLIAAIVAIVAILAVFAGAIGTPEMRQQIQEALRAATVVKP